MIPFLVIICNFLTGHHYEQPVYSCCELQRLKMSLGSDYYISDIIYGG